MRRGGPGDGSHPEADHAQADRQADNHADTFTESRRLAHSERQQPASDRLPRRIARNHQPGTVEQSDVLAGTSSHDYADGNPRLRRDDIPAISRRHSDTARRQHIGRNTNPQAGSHPNADPGPHRNAGCRPDARGRNARAAAKPGQSDAVRCQPPLAACPVENRCRRRHRAKARPQMQKDRRRVADGR